MKPQKSLFTRREKKLLRGLAERVGKKNNCSGMYVRYIIHGKRGTKTPLARTIIEDLKMLLEIFSPS